MHPDKDQYEIIAAYEKFFHFFVNFMRDGYNKRVQEHVRGDKDNRILKRKTLDTGQEAGCIAKNQV